MANTLESIMRLTDEYTATMSKIIQSADRGYKSIQNDEKGVKSLSETMRNVSPAASIAQTGVGGLITRLTTLVSTVYLAKKSFDFLWESIQTGSKQIAEKATFQSLLGNAQVGSDMMDFAAAYGRASSLGVENTASAMTSFLSYTRNIKQIQQLLDLTQRLAMRNPEQGAEGAVFALKEVLAGQTMSLRNRFNMNGVSPETVQKFYEKGDIAGAINYLDQVFNQFGATQGVVEANFNSLSVQADKFKQNLMYAIGSDSTGAAQTLAQTIRQLNDDMNAGKFQPFFTLMSKGTTALANGLSWVAQNANTLAPIVAGAVTAIVGLSIAMKAATLANLIFGASTSAVVGGVFGIIAAVGAIGVGVAVAKNIGDEVSKSAKEAQSLADAAAKVSKDQSAAGLSTKVAVPTTVTNKDPIKVSGTVEIEKENLKYMFDAATAKFFATFNATKVTPVLTIQHQEVTEKADVQEINHELADMLRESHTAGVNYT